MSAPEDAAAEPAPRRRIPGPLWLWIVLALLLALRLVLPFALAPWLAGAASDALGAPVRIGAVDLSLLAGRAQLRQVSLGEGESALRARLLAMDLSWLGLSPNRVRLEDLRLEGLELVLEQGEDGSLRLPALPPAEAAAEPDETPADPGEPLALRIDRFSLVDAGLDWVDAAGGSRARVGLSEAVVGPVSLKLADPLQWQLERLTLSGATAELTLDDPERDAVQVRVDGEVRALDSRNRRPAEVELEAALDGGSLRLAGTFAPTRAVADLEASWEALPLASLARLAPAALRPGLKAGTSEAALELDLAPGEAGAPQLGLRGRLSLADLEGDLAPLAPVRLRVPSLEAEGVDLDGGAAGGRVHLDSLAVGSSRVRVLGSAPAAGEAEAEADSGEPAVWRVTVGRVDLAESRLVYEDRSFQPPVETAVGGLSLAGRGLAWPERRAESLSLQARDLVGGRGSLEVASDGQRGEGRLRVDDLRLLAANPYLRRGSGYQVERGTLDLDTKIRLEESRLRLPTQAVFEGLEVGGEARSSVFEEVFGLSLPMALVLLRNASGDVVLDLPFETDVAAGGGRVDLAPVVVDTTRRVLTNALTSPLQVMGGLLPGSGEGGARTRGTTLDFEAGDDDLDLDRAARKGFDRVAGLLEAHPELALRVDPWVVEADAAALAPEIEDEGDAALHALAEARGRAVVERLRGWMKDWSEDRETLVGEDRVLEGRWDGRVRSGSPRVVVRLELRSVDPDGP